MSGKKKTVLRGKGEEIFYQKDPGMLQNLARLSVGENSHGRRGNQLSKKAVTISIIRWEKGDRKVHRKAEGELPFGHRCIVGKGASQ